MEFSLVIHNFKNTGRDLKIDQNSYIGELVYKGDRSDKYDISLAKVKNIKIEDGEVSITSDVVLVQLDSKAYGIMYTIEDSKEKALEVAMELRRKLNSAKLFDFGDKVKPICQNKEVPEGIVVEVDYPQLTMDPRIRYGVIFPGSLMPIYYSSNELVKVDG